MLPSRRHRWTDSLRCGNSTCGACESSRCTIWRTAVQVDTLAQNARQLRPLRVTDATRLPLCRQKLKQNCSVAGIDTAVLCAPFSHPVVLGCLPPESLLTLPHVPPSAGGAGAAGVHRHCGEQALGEACKPARQARRPDRRAHLRWNICCSIEHAQMGSSRSSRQIPHGRCRSCAGAATAHGTICLPY